MSCPASSASPSFLPAPNAVEIALMAVARSNSSGMPPTFQDETNWRLSRCINATEHLITALENADLHNFDLLPSHLVGVVQLIAQELKTIDHLHDALHACLNQSSQEKK